MDSAAMTVVFRRQRPDSEFQDPSAGGPNGSSKGLVRKSASSRGAQWLSRSSKYGGRIVQSQVVPSADCVQNVWETLAGPCT